MRPVRLPLAAAAAAPVGLAQEGGRQAASRAPTPSQKRYAALGAKPRPMRTPPALAALAVLALACLPPATAMVNEDGSSPCPKEDANATEPMYCIAGAPSPGCDGLDA